jgi:hypothetical protein
MFQSNDPLSQVKFGDTSAVVCEECNNMFFEEVYHLRKISRFLLQGANKDQVLTVPILRCTKCHHVNSEFLPEGLRNDDNENAGTDQH